MHAKKVLILRCTLAATISASVARKTNTHPPHVRGPDTLTHRVVRKKWGLPTDRGYSQKRLLTEGVTHRGGCAQKGGYAQKRGYAQKGASHKYPQISGPGLPIDRATQRLGIPTEGATAERRQPKVP